MSEANAPIVASRRQILSLGAAAGVSSLVGCLGGSGTDGGDGAGSVDTPDQPLPHPTAGDPDAPVTVGVYSDFACPHCQRFNQEILPTIWEEYVEPGEIAYTHFDFPIPVNETVSWEAPSAARSIQVQSDLATYFEYVDRLFANQLSLGPAKYASLADELGADGQRTRDAAENQRYKPTVSADRQGGIDRGVDSTPTVYVNDVDVANKYGSYGADVIADEIESNLS